MPGVSLSIAGNTLFSPDARDSDSRLFLVSSNPSDATIEALFKTPLNLVTSGAEVAGAAVEVGITSVAVTIPILAGTELLFTDAAGSYKAIVSTTVAVGGTVVAITCDLPEDIPSGATAQWPPKLNLLTDLSDTDTTSINSTSTFDHSGTAQTSRGDSEQSVSISGNSEFYNPGLGTLGYGKRNEIDVYLAIYDPNPDSSVFTTNPPIKYGRGKVGELSTSRANGSVITFSGSVTVGGGFKLVAPE